MALVLEKENVQATNFQKTGTKKIPLKLNAGNQQSLANSSKNVNSKKFGPFGVSFTKSIGRRALGDLKNLRLNENNQNSQEKSQDLKSSKKLNFAELPKQNLKQDKPKEDLEEIEICPNINEPKDTFDDILPCTERVAACFPQNCFDKLFVSTSAPPSFDVNSEEIWNLDSLPVVTVEDILKQADDLRSDSNYPISDAAYGLIKEMCDALRD